MPVYSSADGYVARVKIEPTGFGRAIYINHPNGFTTLYAHLNDFFPELEAYVKENQYQQEAWKVFLDLPPDLFSVKKGDVIAYSGNTGGSQAPHLHFEIRRTIDDVNVNPLLFGFPVADNTKPMIVRLAVYDRNKSTYEQNPKIFAVKKSGDGYIATPSLIKVASDKISFAITALDTHSGSINPNGIYEAWLFVDDELITGFQMDNISYDNTRYLNAHIDYRTRFGGGPFLQHLSQLPGYVNSIYINIKSDGVIHLSDSVVHFIRIVVKDTYGNTSELKYTVQSSGYSKINPESSGKKFYPNMVEVYEREDCEFFIAENCLYDSVHIRHTRTTAANPMVVSAVHTIGAPSIPLQDSFMVRIKPLPIFTKDTQHVIMQRLGGAKKEVSKVAWYNGWASARFQDFGNFQLVVDKEPPLLVPFGITNGANLSNASRIAFTVRDNLEKVNNFRAELDGKWLQFTNDKKRTFIYRFDEMCPPGQHELKISVEDEAGNIATRLYQFTR